MTFDCCLDVDPHIHSNHQTFFVGVANYALRTCQLSVGHLGLSESSSLGFEVRHTHSQLLMVEHPSVITPSSFQPQLCPLESAKEPRLLFDCLQAVVELDQ